MLPINSDDDIYMPNSNIKSSKKLGKLVNGTIVHKIHFPF